MPNEPSMEEILSSIKRIIAEEDRVTPAPRAPKRAPAPRPAEPVQSSTPEAISAEADDQILELTEIVPAEPQPSAAPAPAPAAKAEPAKPVARVEPKAPEAKAPEIKAEVRMESKAARSEPARAPRPRETAALPPEAATQAAVLSELSAKAARESLDNLSRMLVRTEDGQSNTLEGLVREMLRPMLKDWLDANLPTIVETLVKREVDRITGRV